MTIIVETLGADSTAYLRLMLERSKDELTSVIFEEAEEKNLQEIAGVTFVPTSASFEQLGQGCACCTVRSDLMTRIKGIVNSRAAERIVIQLDANGDLDVLSKTFTVAGSDGTRLLDSVNLKQVVTVINAERMLGQVTNEEASTLVARIRAASVLFVEDSSILDTNAYEQLVRTLKSLNPRAQIFDGAHLASPPTDEINQGSKPNADLGAQNWSCDVPITIDG